MVSEMLDAELLEILICPRCKGKLEYVEEPAALVCRTCQLKFPIRDDVPILLLDEAEPAERE